jgi:hypothetical protein
MSRLSPPKNNGLVKRLLKSKADALTRPVILWSKFELGSAIVLCSPWGSSYHHWVQSSFKFGAFGAGYVTISSSRLGFSRQGKESSKGPEDPGGWSCTPSSSLRSPSLLRWNSKLESVHIAQIRRHKNSPADNSWLISRSHDLPPLSSLPVQFLAKYHRKSPPPPPPPASEAEAYSLLLYKWTE